MSKEFLQELREKRQTYRDMIDFCVDSMVMNNYIVKELEAKGFYFDIFCGDYSTYYNKDGEEITREEYEELCENDEECEEVYDDIYQYFIINRADLLEEYTNELVIYNEDLDLYILCVKHFGTSWDYVSADWREEPKEMED